MRRILTSAAVATVLAAPGLAQSGQDSQPDARFPGTTPAFQEWQAEHAGSWILRERPETQAGRFLYGGSLAPSFTPTSDADFEQLAREGLAETASLFQIAPETLQLEQVRLLPLSRAGIRDKVAVNFVQVQRGVPVVRGHVDLLFHTDGTLVAIDSLAYPGVEGIETAPVISAERATREAAAWFAEESGLAALRTTSPQLVIYPDSSGKLDEPRLAWSLELWNETAQLPTGHRAYVSADSGAPQVLGHDVLVHECGLDHDHSAHEHHDAHELTSGPQPLDFTGHVDSWASPGVLPDTAANPEILMPMKYMRVASSVGETETDANGDFVLPYSGTNPVDLTFEYRGSYARIYNQNGATYSFSQSFTPGVFDTAVMNAARAAQDTAHANVYRSIIDMREWLLDIDPSETTLNFQVRGNVNISDTCNAYFNGSSINFYLAGGGCVNTAYSTVSAHEEGHWLNVLYSSGNGPDGFGEGAADIWAMYLYDTPIVGQNFCGTGCNIRTGNNTRQWCGSGCYGQVHTDGEVLMGAAWKVRENLNTSLGNAAGDMVANALAVAWFQAYNDGQILPVIEEHWLALDDDDGNIGNGTPNFVEIDDGFRAQGFPGVELDYISFVHTELRDTQNETGPYAVLANLTPEFGSAITAATLHYTINGGPEQTVPMSPLGGGNYRADIPGQPSPTEVVYWLSASDDLGNDDRYPKKSDAGFLVGLRRIAYFNDFDRAAAEGWSSAYGGGTSNNHNDWQHDSPKGNGGDPSSAYSGNLIWGNDVGNAGWNGLYQANVNIRLISPTIDCSAYSDLRLRFARWLTVERGEYDNARLRVAGNVIWENAYSADHLDSSWQIADYDVSAVADGNPAVVMRWELATDGGVEFGGWNIDDVMLYSLAPSGATDTIILSGDETPNAGSTANFSFRNGPEGGNWYAVYATNLNGLTYQGHAFDIGAPYTIAATGSFDEQGSGSLGIPVPPGAAGVTVYLEIAGIDWEGSVTDSNPLTVTVQ